MWVLGLVAGTGMLCAGLFAYTQYQLEKTKYIAPPTGQFVEVGGSRLHYVRVGHGPAIVLIHGLGGMLQDFAPLFDLLAATNEVIAIDRPGYGHSEQPDGQPLSARQQVKMIHQALTTLGVQKPILVGHSLGGGIALGYALAYPDEISELFLIAPAAYPVERGASLVGKAGLVPVLGDMFYSLFALPLSRLVAPYTVRHAFSPDTVPANYLARRLALTSRPTQLRSSARDLASMNQFLEANASLYWSITVPVFILSGDSDRLLDFSSQSMRLHNAIPGSSLLVIPGAGHMLPYARSKEVLAGIRQHLAGS